MKIKVVRIYRLLVGAIGLFLPLLLLFSHTQIYYPIRIFDYIVFVLTSAACALLVVTFEDTIVSFEIAIFLFLSMLYGPYLGGVTAGLVILAVWIGKSIYQYLNRNRRFISAFLAGFFNAGLYGLLYLIGGLVYWKLGPSWKSFILAVITIILFNEAILFVNKVIERRDLWDYSKSEALWSDLIELLVYPLAFSLYMLYTTFGLWSIVPLLVILVILSYYGNSFSRKHEQMKKNLYILKRVNEIATELSSLLSPNELIELYLKDLVKLFSLNSAAVKWKRLLSYVKGHVMCDQEGNVRYLKLEELIKADLVFLLKSGEFPLGELYVVTRKKLSEYEIEALNSLVKVLTNSLSRAITYQDSIVDSLTGLYNRRFFEESVKKLIAESKRNRNIFTVVMFDIDRLKYVNDNFGHLKGDELLVNFANAVRKNIRENDFASRWGGDEFILVLKGTGLSMAENISYRMQQEFESSKLVGIENFKPSCTFACQMFEPESNLSIQDLFHQIDLKLLENKKKKYG